MKYAWLALSLFITPAYADGIINPGSGSGGSTTITAGSTPTSGFAAGDLVKSDGSVVQKLTPGANVSAALVAALNGASGLVGYSGNIGAAAGTSLAIGGCTISTNAFCVTGASTVGNLAIGAGSAITSSGAGGALGSNAFTSTAYAPIANPTFTGIATSPSFSLAGNISAAAWTTNGIRLIGVPATLTDTSSSGTVAAAYTDSLGGSTIAASSSTTYTDYYSLHLSGPTAGSNVAFTRSWALGLGGAEQIALSGLAATTAIGQQLVNPTASTSGVPVQVSPSLNFQGHAWNTTSVAADNFADGQISLLPVSGTTPFASMLFQTRISVAGSGAFSNAMILNDGALGTTSFRNGTTAQTVKAFASYTDASNGSWAAIDTTTANTVIFGGFGNGTGASTLSKLQFGVAGVANALSYTANGNWVFVTSAGISFGGGSIGWSYNGTLNLQRASGFSGFGMAATAIGVSDALFRSPSAASWVFGYTDAASPVAQSLGVQSVVAGTSNTAGAAFSEYDSAGTGSGATGGYNWYTHPSGAGATVQNTAVLGMTFGIAGVNALNVIGGYYVNSTKGVTCSGALTVVSSITITGGIITAATGTGGTCS